MSDVVTVLKKAEELLEQGWCQGAMARTADGSVCSYTDDRACCWCLKGSLFRVNWIYKLDWRETEQFLERRLANPDSSVCMPSLADWNDNLSRTKGEVIAFVRDSIREFEALEAAHA